LIGSPAFMSPEQLRGVTPIAPHSDIWSLGVVAYETLTGQPCFEGLTVMDVFAAISVPRYRLASRVRPELPRGIDAWIARSITLQPGDRFGTGEEMAAAFRALVAKSRRSYRPLAAAALLATAALAGVLIVRSRSTPAVAQPAAPVTAATSTAPAAAP